MKKSIISFICGALSMAVFGGGAVAFASGAWKTINVLENDISVVVDGIRVNESNFLYNDTTYLPLRAVAEAVGKEVTYDERTNTAYIGSNSSTAHVGTTYYSGFSINIPDYTSVTGVPLKERFDTSDGGAILWYEYTNEDDITNYGKELIKAGFDYLGMKDGSFYFSHQKYGIVIEIDKESFGHVGDLSIFVIKN